MKVLVTGAKGQLALSLLERAEDHSGFEIIALGRPQLDLEVSGSAERAIVDARPDIVINAAAIRAIAGDVWSPKPPCPASQKKPSASRAKPTAG